MKRVLYLSYDGLTDPLGQSQILPYLCGLSKFGYQFTILSFEKAHLYKAQKEKIEKICIENSIDWQPRIFHASPPILSKIYDKYIFKTEATRLHKKKKFNLLHCRSYVSAEIGLYIKKHFGVPFLFDMRGFWADEKVDGGNWNLKNPFFKKLYKYYKNLERKCVIESAHIISLTNAAKKELSSLYDPSLKEQNININEKCSVIPCCADLFSFDYNKISAEDILLLKKKISIPQNSKVLTYSGSLGTWYMIDEMLMFFDEYKKQNEGAKFLILTKDKDILEKAITEGKINKEDLITLFTSKEELPKYLSLSDASIFLIRNTYSKVASSPTKHAEIMGLGIPVFCNDIGDTGYFLRNFPVGELIDIETSSNNYADIINTFQSKIYDKQLIRECALHNFDLGMGVSLYKNAYEKII